ncbi:MAG: CPBP family intramembrane glutamic endopeptidase [Gemmatimonadaceae bacterium]
MASTVRAQARDYWSTSRSHRHSLLFALPLLLLYELLEVVSPVRASGGVIRNGADVLLTGIFSWMLGPRGPLVFMALVIGGALWLIFRDRSGGQIRASTLGAMLGESLVLALLFGLVVGTATVQLVGPLRALAASNGLDGGPLARLTLSLGAGLYEELLFRVVIVALLANGLHLLGFGRLSAGTLATITGALLFSAFHYIGPLGEPLRLESFVFRALAGLAFSVLYLTRGFGITAWTHALYDVSVLF